MQEKITVCPICGNPVKEKAPAEVELQQGANEINQLQDTADEDKSQDESAR